MGGPVVLFLIPGETLQSAPDLCLFRLLLDVECWGCGMTRALRSLLHFDLTAAAAFNWRVFIVAPILAFYALKTIREDVLSFRAWVGGWEGRGMSRASTS